MYSILKSELISVKKVFCYCDYATKVPGIPLIWNSLHKFWVQMDILQIFNIEFIFFFFFFFFGGGGGGGLPLILAPNGEGYEYCNQISFVCSCA